jgi:hypothetical protein
VVRNYQDEFDQKFPAAIGSYIPIGGVVSIVEGYAIRRESPLTTHCTLTGLSLRARVAVEVARIRAYNHELNGTPLVP